MTKLGVRATLLWGAAAIGITAGASLAQDSIGVTSAVNPDATGTPPQRPTRTLNVGLDMFKNEKVSTGPVGKTQLLFLDGSALTIGPNSEMVLDEFVYDPVTQTGKLAMSATKGIFRLVGGKISKTEPVTLTTPTATIGIRGGIGTVAVGTGNDFAGLQFGKMNVAPAAQDQAAVELIRPGTGVSLLPDGHIGPSIPFPAEILTRILGALEGDRGRGGGGREQPTDNRVRQTGVGQSGSSNDPNALRTSEAAADSISNVANDVFDSTGLSQASQSDVTSEFQGSSRFGSFNFSGRYKSTPGSGFTLGAGDNSVFFNRFLFGGILGNVFNGFTVNLSGSSSSFLDDYAAPIGGTVISTNPRGTFFSFGTGGTNSPFGPIQGTGFLSKNNDFLYYENIEVSFTNERSLAFAGIPTPLALIQAIGPGGLLTYDIRQDGIFGSQLPFILAASGGNLAGTRSKAYVLSNFNHVGSQIAFLQGNLAIVGQGTAQQSAVSLLTGRVVGSPFGNGLLDGFARGSFRTGSGNAAGFLFGALGFGSDAFGNGIFGAAAPDFAVLESSDSLNPVQAGFSYIATGLPQATGITQNLNNVNSLYFPNNLAMRTDNPAGVGTTRQSRTLTGFANAFLDTFLSNGTLSSTQVLFSNATSNVSLVTDAVNNTVSGSIGGSASGNLFTLPFGASTGDGRSAFIDNNLYGAVESSSGALRNGVAPTAVRMYVVGNELVSTSNFLPNGVSYCACSLSTWGYFGMDLLHSAGVDRISLGQFVAGPIPANVPAIGSATYNGHAVADVALTSGARYKAAGTFSLSYNFSGSPSSTWTVNIDGGTLSSIVTVSPGSPLFSGSLGGSTANITGITGFVRGGFFGGSSVVIPPEVGSAFNGSGTGGQIAGITQGKTP